MNCNIRLEVFEGPFDLLIHLIQKNQVDIYDIPIAEIARQYINYLKEMSEYNIDIASGFVVMAANLLAIKARMLMPVHRVSADEDIEIDVRSELVDDILEYLRYQQAATALADLYLQEAKFFERQNDAQLYVHMFEEQNPFEGKTAKDLFIAFQKVLEDSKRQPFVLEIVREGITIKERIAYITQLLIENSKGVSFFSFFPLGSSLEVLTVSFLALLEMIHQNLIKARQTENFGEIYIYPYRIKDIAI